MNREYHKWYSQRLGRDMELLIFGHAGLPLLVFPTSMGRFFDYADRGMIDAVAGKYQNGALQAFCVDSVDGESWYNQAANPHERVLRHMQYEGYIAEEVMPFLRSCNWSQRRVSTGCSFGGYHAMNLALKRPDLITDCVSMSGAYDIKRFLQGYYDDNCYYNNPPDYLPHLDISALAERNFVLAAGEWDICLGENYDMARLLGHKGIRHTLDVWGDHAEHDWPLWQAMAHKFFGG